LQIKKLLSGRQATAPGIPAAMFFYALMQEVKYYLVKNWWLGKMSDY
jgi:hypothetical protein